MFVMVPAKIMQYFNKLQRGTEEIINMNLVQSKVLLSLLLQIFMLTLWGQQVIEKLDRENP